MKNSIGFQLSQVSNFQRIQLEKAMSSVGLHSGQFFVLLSLWEADGQSQAQLVKNLQVTPPTIYNMVVRMAESGFVELRKCPSDARLMRVFLTEKGRSVKESVERQWTKLEELMFSELTETEKMMFSMLLQKVGKTNE